jgi:hypothetical protein
MGLKLKHKTLLPLVSLPRCLASSAKTNESQRKIFPPFYRFSFRCQVGVENAKAFEILKLIFMNEEPSQAAVELGMKANQRIAKGKNKF